MTYIVAIIFCLPRKRKQKQEKDIWDLIRLKSVFFFLTKKGTISNMKRPPTEWEKIFANSMIDRANI